MSAQQVKDLSETTRNKLRQAIEMAEEFLNEHALGQLCSNQDPDEREFYEGFLSDLRHLLVFSEVNYEKLGINLRRPTFNVEQAERQLYETYYQSVNNFYYPKNESYSEEGRYAYTGQDAIKFRKKPNKEARNIVFKLSKIFEEMREDLSYYETEYAMQRRLQGERV